MERMINQAEVSDGTKYDVQVTAGLNSTIYTIPSPTGMTRACLFDILPHMHIVFFEMHDDILLKGVAEAIVRHPLQFNFCLDGRAELKQENGTCFYLRAGDVSLSHGIRQIDASFPTGFYRGITLFFSPDFFSEDQENVSELLGVSPSRLQALYFTESRTYIAQANTEVKNILERLSRLSETSSTFHMKLCVLELLNLLLDRKDVCPQQAPAFYSASQVEIAKKAKAILTEDLKKHIPMKTIAEQFNISETSLKNYFRGVYGQNVSDYLRDLRTDIAQKMLTDTDLPISEIATRIGYTKQGKFAEIFRKKYGINPLEYRRLKRMEQAADRGSASHQR